MWEEALAGRKKPSICFACPHCTSRLAAPLRLAERKLRCPYCYHVLTVPKESSPSRRGEEYQLAESSSGEPGEQPRYITVVCPVCATRVYGTEDQLGQQMPCPDCGTVLTIQRPATRAAEQRPAPVTAEEYPVYQGEGQPPLTSREVYQRYIPVVCPVCATRLMATEDQVGQELVCPDCQTATRVPPPKTPGPEELEKPRQAETYELAEGEIRSAQHEQFIPIVCGVCHTRLHATAQQVGREIICPDCSTRLIVPKPQDGPAVLPRESIEGYEVSAAPAPRRPPLILRGFEPIVDDGPLRPVQESAEEEDRWPRDRPERARQRAAEQPSASRPGSFIVGVFGFPFYESSQGILSILSLGSILVAAMACLAVMLGQSDHPATSLLSACLTVLTVIVFLIWYPAASARCLHIVRETGSGSEEVWPTDLSWFDQILECLYLVFANGLVIALGAGIVWLLGAVGLPASLIGPSAGVAMTVLFPIVLLSMLENQSPIAPVSVLVLQSLVFDWKAWAAFYLVSTLAFGAAGLIVWLACAIAGCLAVIVAALALGWATMVYFRLLGRLAWHIAQLYRTPQPETGQDEID